MSDDSSEKTVKTDRPEGKPESWSSIHQDLKSALDAWTDLSQKQERRKSPEEQQLEDMRRLLADLKSKIREFDV